MVSAIELKIAKLAQHWPLNCPFGYVASKKATTTRGFVEARSTRRDTQKEELLKEVVVVW